MKYGVYMLQIHKNTVVQRAVFNHLQQRIEPGKVTVLYGPRRVGKTTLLGHIISAYEPSEKILSVTGENLATHDSLSSRKTETLTQFVGDATLLIIDEAQLIPDIGRNLKLLIDTHPDLKIVASGSASFGLAQSIGEPLVGRKWTVYLYPFWIKELIDHASWFDVSESLEALLVYGAYPEVLQNAGYDNKRDMLRELVDSYLYKDILSIEQVRKPKLIRNLLELLAYQVGNEVSLTALGGSLGVDKETVSRYLDLLEQAFVVVNIRGFSRNLRKEVTKTSRYYFYDTGIRNALLGNFTHWQKRDDREALWENWLVMERLKKQAYTRMHSMNYFWRTYDQKEIDWIEERGGNLYGYEFSWRQKNIRSATQREFIQAYPKARLDTVHQENYKDFVV